ncbi:MAG: glycine oxidase ThiO [Planctomycetaceae bacterium]|nr:glycine oxidase ThiO [Planctomycetaceae bacterium]
MQQVVIIGGGVIGLTSAYALSRAGVKVCVLDQSEPGREASWAGAGMLPPGGRGSEPQVLQQLAAQSAQEWAAFSASLLEQTGIDNGYRCFGAFNFAASAEELNAEFLDWQAGGVSASIVETTTLHEAVSCLSSRHTAAIHLPTAAQIRNPHHLQALQVACQQQGVEIHGQQEVVELERSQGRIVAARTPNTRWLADQFLVASGSWSQKLLAGTGCSIEVEPVRGQIVLLNCGERRWTHTLETGSRYIVPRDDGRVLIGATEEHVGFEKRNTLDAIARLCSYAADLIPELADATFERCWSGLRPYSRRGRPYVGRIPELDNLFVAAGHFRAGLSLSPATGRLVCDLMCGGVVDPLYSSLLPTPR